MLRRFSYLMPRVTCGVAAVPAAHLVAGFWPSDVQQQIVLLAAAIVLVALGWIVGRALRWVLTGQ